MTFFLPCQTPKQVYSQDGPPGSPMSYPLHLVSEQEGHHYHHPDWHQYERCSHREEQRDCVCVCVCHRDEQRDCVCVCVCVIVTSKNPWAHFMCTHVYQGQVIKMLHTQTQKAPSSNLTMATSNSSHVGKS